MSGWRKKINVPIPNSQLNNPNLMKALNYHHNSLIRVFREEIIQNDYGEEITTYVGSDQVIRGYVEPIQGQEIRRADDTLVLEAYKVSLQGYYPEIRVSDKLLIRSQYHNILAVGSDDTETVTIATTEIVNPPEGV